MNYETLWNGVELLWESGQFRLGTDSVVCADFARFSKHDKIADLAKGSDKPKEAVTTSADGAPVINSNPNYLEEQATEIKKQLISLIDSVTEASDNLLERLYEDDIMDITTDIQSLQTTLSSKGLLDSDFDIQ